MSHILAEWVNREVGLSKSIDANELHSNFRSGYLFGELLGKLKISLSDRDEFVDSNTIDALIKNYSALEKILRDRLDIKLSSNCALEIINGKQGAATRLLYQIKSSINEIQNSSIKVNANGHHLLSNGGNSIRTKAKKKTGTRSHQELLDEDLTSCPTIPLGDVAILIHNNHEGKRIYHSKEAEFFTDMLKSKLKRNQPIPTNVPPLPRTLIKVEVNRKINHGEKHKASSNKCGTNTQDLKSSNRGNSPSHLCHQNVRFSNRLENSPEIKQSRKGVGANPIYLDKSLTQKSPRVASTFYNDISKFESKLDIGRSPYNVPDEQNSLSGDNNEYPSKEPLKQEFVEFIRNKASMSPSDHLDHLSRLVPLIDSKEVESLKYLEKIRNQRIEEECSRKDRDHRRRKIILHQQQMEQEMESLNMEDFFLSKLMRQSKQERRIAEQLMQTRHEKEVIHENRVFRERQYVERRKIDYEEALVREFELAERSRVEYKKQMEQQLSQHQEILCAKKSKKHEKNIMYCTGILNELIDLTFKISEYRVLNNYGKVPLSQMRQWKTLFISGESAAKCATVDIECEAKSAVGLEELDPILKADTHVESGCINQLKEHILDDAELNDYLDSTGIWCTPLQIPITNPLLGRLLEDIMELTTMPDVLHEIIPIPSAPLRIAILGKPFSGKLTLAKNLAQIYNMTLICMDDLIKEAISAENTSIKKSAQDPKDKSSKKPISKQQIGAKIQMDMVGGHGPDDNLLVLLIIDALRQHPEKSGGWILVGFPQTRAQAQLLERELSGYEDPKPIKKGDLKRTKDKGRSAPKSRSLIAPSEPQGDSPPVIPISGLNCVLLLDVDNETVIGRSVGQRVDTITGDNFHIDLNPPPKILPGTIDRLALLEDESKTNAQLQYQLAAFEEEEQQLKDWLCRFRSLKVVDASCSSDNTLKLALAIVNDVIGAMGETSIETDICITEDNGCVANASHEKRKVSIPAHGNDIKSTDHQYTPQGNADLHTINGPAALSLMDRLPPVRSQSRGSFMQNQGASLGDSEEKLKNGGSFLQPNQPKEKDIRNDTGSSSSAFNLDTAVLEPITLPTANIQNEFLPHHISRTNTPSGRKLPSRELTEIMMDQWATLESTYTYTLKFAFRSLRQEHDSILRYFFDIRTLFKKFLERPDLKQDLLDTSQVEYNSIEDDLRSDPETKAELHQRVEDLRDRLWDISDKRREEADSERLALLEDKWVEDHSTMLANIYISTMQAELDRYLGSRQLIMDYYRDASASLLTDLNRSQIRIQPNLSTSQPPVEIASVLISAFESHAAHRKEGTHGTGIGGPVVPTTVKPIKANTFSPVVQGQGKEKDLGRKGVAAIVKGGNAIPNVIPAPIVVPDQSVRHSVLTQFVLPEKEQIVIDYEDVNFPDIQDAYDMCISAIQQPDYNNSDTSMSGMLLSGEKRDKKKGAENGDSDDTDTTILPDHIRALEAEEQVLRYRLERIRRRSVDHLKELRRKGFECFILLDDWIGLRFQGEMNATKDMMNVIKEAIESEAKLPNKLSLIGEDFKVDFGQLTLEPEPEARPESPLEKTQADQFTVLQLLDLSRQLKLLAPSGRISCKSFLDYIIRTAALSSASDTLPEGYFSADQSQFTQICTLMDPFETGYINWRRFIMLHARILPIPLNLFIDMKSNLSSFTTSSKSGPSKDEFDQTTLWFEKESHIFEESQSKKFDRFSKLKDALFYLFSYSTPTKSIDANDSNVDAAQIESTIFENNDHLLLDTQEFLACCALDKTSSAGLLKAFYAFGTENGQCSVDNVYDALHHFLFLTESSHRLERGECLEDPYPMEAIHRIFDSANIPVEGKISFETFWSTCETMKLFIPWCPLYEIEDVTIYNVGSRPSSGLSPGKGVNASKTNQ
ncbi:hypothetical protein BASA62_002468 [Batrachochytrium salamandrivorans]|nr:hypothetical protein BASA62_002468 [Batrachochytrium salamandrivorans]